jgi:hypothetical protein
VTGRFHKDHHYGLNGWVRISLPIHTPSHFSCSKTRRASHQSRDQISPERKCRHRPVMTGGSSLLPSQRRDVLSCPWCHPARHPVDQILQSGPFTPSDSPRFLAQQPYFPGMQPHFRHFHWSFPSEIHPPCLATLGGWIFRSASQCRSTLPDHVYSLFQIRGVIKPRRGEEPKALRRW